MPNRSESGKCDPRDTVQMVSIGPISRLAAEPPLRLLARWYIRNFSGNLAARARWAVDPYPAYQFGILTAAGLAANDGIKSITVIEFGVAGGSGLLNMQRYAAAIEAETGVAIYVVGFDNGSGLPAFIGDYRDHPDQWRPGSYPLDVARLSNQLNQKRTRLIIGNVKETVPQFVETNSSPVGFISFDLDLYSSTRDALEVLRSRGRKMLRQTPLYFDDIDFAANHRWAGALLAIEEFNQTCELVKIDKWYNIKTDKPFHEAHHWEKMFVAHDLEAISLYRPPKRLKD